MAAERKRKRPWTKGAPAREPTKMGLRPNARERMERDAAREAAHEARWQTKLGRVGEMVSTALFIAAIGAAVYFVFLDNADGRRSGAGWLLIGLGFLAMGGVYASASKALDSIPSPEEQEGEATRLWISAMRAVPKIAAVAVLAAFLWLAFKVAPE